MSLKHKWSSWPLQRTYDLLITSLLRQNGAVTSCWRNNDVRNTPCVPCDSDPLYKSLGALKKAWNLIEIYMVLILKISIRSGLNFAHVTTVLLPWHVQNSWPDRSIRMARKEALNLWALNLFVWWLLAHTRGTEVTIGRAVALDHRCVSSYSE